jgi:hypothetical protein
VKNFLAYNDSHRQRVRNNQLAKSNEPDVKLYALTNATKSPNWCKGLVQSTYTLHSHVTGEEKVNTWTQTGEEKVNTWTQAGEEKVNTWTQRGATAILQYKLRKPGLELETLGSDNATKSPNWWKGLVQSTYTLQHPNSRVTGEEKVNTWTQTREEKANTWTQMGEEKVNTWTQRGATSILQ